MSPMRTVATSTAHSTAGTTSRSGAARSFASGTVTGTAKCGGGTFGILPHPWRLMDEKHLSCGFCGSFCVLLCAGREMILDRPGKAPTPTSHLSEKASPLALPLGGLSPALLLVCSNLDRRDRHALQAPTSPCRHLGLWDLIARLPLKRDPQNPPGMLACSAGFGHRPRLVAAKPPLDFPPLPRFEKFLA